MNDRVKDRRYFYGATSETDNFAFEINVTLGLESIFSAEKRQKYG